MCVCVSVRVRYCVQIVYQWCYVSKSTTWGFFVSNIYIDFYCTV